MLALSCFFGSLKLMSSTGIENGFERMQLGHSDMFVSQIGYGTYHLREKLGSAEAIDSLGAAFDHGITLFDTSDNYGTEELIGIAIKEGALPRDEVVIATKTGLATSAREHQQWSLEGKKVDTSPERIKTQVDKSLRLLGVEVIDLYQLHVEDTSISAETHVEAMNDLIAAGKIRGYGVSNYSADGIRNMLAASQRLGLEPPVTSQPFMNLLRGAGEAGSVAQQAGLAILAHSPLHKGMLTDAGVDLARIDLGQVVGADSNIELFESGLNALQGLRIYAASKGLTLAQLAIGWAAAHDNTAVLCACTDDSYIEDARIGVMSQLDADADELTAIRERINELPFFNQSLSYMKAAKIYYR